MVQSTSRSIPKEPKVNPWLVLSATGLSTILVMINLGALNVALPAIARHYHAGVALSSWILLSYMLVNTILILVFGQFSDVYGRRNLFLLGTVVFTIMSFLIGYAPNIWIFITLRVLQAAGGALIISNNSALITDAFPPESLGKGLGMNVLIASAAQLLGPVVGGVLASQLGWRWVFWSGVPVGIVGFVWGVYVLRKIPSSGSGAAIDLLGGILIFFSLSGLILALSEGETLSWTHPLVVAGFIMFLVLTPILIVVELKSPSPMINLTLFKDIPYAMGNISAFLSAFTRVSVVLLISLYMQTVLHVDASIAGVEVLPVTIGMLVTSPISGSLSNKYSARLLSTTGLGISCIGLLIILFALGPHQAYLPYALGMLCVGVGTGLFMTPNTKSILTSVPADHRGFANGLRSMLQNMGQVLSTASCLTIISAGIPKHLQDAVTGASASLLPYHDVLLLTAGYHWAFITLIIATLIGVFVSLAR